MDSEADPYANDDPELLRVWLASRALALGIPADDGDDWIDAVLERDVTVPEIGRAHV